MYAMKNEEIEMPCYLSPECLKLFAEGIKQIPWSMLCEQWDNESWHRRETINTSDLT